MPTKKQVERACAVADLERECAQLADAYDAAVAACDEDVAYMNMCWLIAARAELDSVRNAS